MVGGGQSLTVECSALSETDDLHIAGLATIHLSAVPTFDGGQIFVEMQDGGMREAILPWHQGAQAIAECFRQHGNDPIGKVGAVAPHSRFSV